METGRGGGDRKLGYSNKPHCFKGIATAFPKQSVQLVRGIFAVPEIASSLADFTIPSTIPIPESLGPQRIIVPEPVLHQGEVFQALANHAHLREYSEDRWFRKLSASGFDVVPQPVPAGLYGSCDLEIDRTISAVSSREIRQVAVESPSAAHSPYTRPIAQQRHNASPFQFRPEARLVARPRKHLTLASTFVASSFRDGRCSRVRGGERKA
jgi:hypothetical protein